MRRTVLALLLLPLLAGCEGLLPPQACTLIGCSDGLSVRLSEVPAGAYTLAAILPDGTVREVRCSGVAPCGTVTFFPEVTAAEVTIRVTTEAGTRTEVFRPTYTRHRPNGRHCPPTCLQGEVTVRLPE